MKIFEVLKGPRRRTSIFITYRRKDVEGEVRAIYKRLTEAFGEDEVFVDIGAIDPGDDFARRIREALAGGKALIVVIGPRWLDILTQKAHSQGPGTGEPDYVREEIGQALRSAGMRVLPLLVQGAQMPTPASLPADLRDLAAKHAITINGSSQRAWDSSLDEVVDAVLKGGVQRSYRRHLTVGGAVAGALAVVLAAVVVATRPGEGVVPEVIGVPYGEAEARIRNAGFAPQVKFTPIRDDQAHLSEKVFEVHPRVGERLRRGEKVMLGAYRRYSYPLVCRGGGSLQVTKSNETTASFDLQVRFERSARVGGESLAPGTCSWTDRTLAPKEPLLILLTAMESSAPVADLQDPATLKVFCVYNDSRGHLFATAVRNYMEFRGGRWQPRLRLCSNDPT